MKDLLYTIAKDNAGNLIKANEASKGDRFCCVICAGDLILRKSERQLRRPHFAHKHLTQNCTPESALHYSFKTLLFKKILKHLQNNSLLEVEWNCSFCNEKHSGNLLKKIISAKLEFDLTVCKPDITLLDSNEKPLAVVEVVVKHSPENTSLNYYNINNIILIQFNLTCNDDINLINNTKLNPSFVNFCYNPKCHKCGHFQLKKYLSIIEGQCWKCNSSIKVAVISIDQIMLGGPESFAINEITLAQQKGVFIQNRYSKTAEESYLANVCCRCHSFIGCYTSLFSDFYVPATEGQLNREVLDIGYFCMNCHDQSEQAIFEKGKMQSNQEFELTE